jgi:hypothetical protein
MSRRFFSKMAPLVLLCGIFSSAVLVGCGPADELGALRQEVHETKAAVLNQTDFNSFLSAVNLRGCTFLITGGTGTFTPSSELSQALYGDPNGSAHKLTFTVPPISSSGASIEITTLEAEMANTGITLSGSTATIKLAFHGTLKVSVTVPIFGKLKADIQIRSSSISFALTYDKANDRLQVASVTSKIDAVTKNCGGTGWCNGIFDGVLKTNLASWIETPLRDALNKAFEDPDTTAGFQDLLLVMYNRKDPKTPPWTLVAKTMELSTGAFRFNVERDAP